MWWLVAIEALSYKLQKANKRDIAQKRILKKQRNEIKIWQIKRIESTSKAHIDSSVNKTCVKWNYTRWLQNVCVCVYVSVCLCELINVLWLALTKTKQKFLIKNDTLSIIARQVFLVCGRQGERERSERVKQIEYKSMWMVGAQKCNSIF